MNRSSQLFLLRELIRRDFTQRYAGSLLGLAWSFLQPLWQLVLLSIVFSLIIRLDISDEVTSRFWVFLFCGLLPWTAIHEGVMRCSTVIVEHADMVKKIAFPAELLVVGVVSTALLHQGVTLVVFLGALVAIGELAWTNLYLLPMALLFQVLLTLGIGYAVAAVQVYFRDVVQVLGLVMNAWFYLTPIVYPLQLLGKDEPSKYAALIGSNPLAVLVTLYRHALLGGDAERWTSGMVPLVVTTAILFAGGLWLFRRLKPGFADEI